MDEKQRYTFDIFVAFLTPVDALTNSALVELSRRLTLVGHDQPPFGSTQREAGHDLLESTFEIIPPMHYWLRRPLGLKRLQKCQKYTSVSHPLNSPNDICCSFWVGYDPNIIQKKNK